MLKVSKNLSLPVETVAQSVGILAKKRVGKSYTARRLTEQLLKAGQQVVIVDPKGDWWGVRSSGDGKRPGYPVVILGGERADVPLEVGAGEVVAKLAAEEGVSALLDLSLFRKHEVATFMSSFLENLYRLKAREKFRTPLMLMIDEADAIAPQKPMKGEERMLGAAEDIVRRGGQRGLGCTLITQRSAVLNKNVLTQTQMLIVLRTIAPQDRKAIDEWIDVHGTPEERKTLMESIASLPVGDAWFWSPGWPSTDGIFTRTHVLPIETFDSGATPKPGEKRREPKNLADVDLDALQRQMSETIERAKADDPKLLKKRIRELEKAAQKQQPSATVPDQGAIDKAVQRAVTERDRHWKGEVAKIQRDLQSRNRTLQRIERDAQAIAERAHLNGEATVETAAPPPIRTPVRNPAPCPQRPSVKGVSATSRASTEGLTSAQQRILDALAWWDSIGVAEPTVEQVAFVARINPKGGHFSNSVGPLSTNGFIERTSGAMRLTPDGLAAANAPDSAPTIDDYHDGIRKILKSGAQVRILDAVIESGEEATTEDIGAATGIDPGGGHFSNSIGPLGTLGLIERRAGVVRPTELLFPPGL